MAPRIIKTWKGAVFFLEEEGVHTFIVTLFVAYVLVDGGCRCWRGFGFSIWVCR